MVKSFYLPKPVYVHILTNVIQSVPGSNTFKYFFSWYFLKKAAFLSNKTIVNVLKLKDKLQAEKMYTQQKANTYKNLPARRQILPCSKTE